MYEELIKILYHLSEIHKYEPFYPSDKLREAADAIVALSKKENATHWFPIPELPKEEAT